MGTCTVTYGNSSWTEDVSGDVSVKYNDIEIASVAPGSSKTLYCLGDLMRGKLKIGNKVLNCLKKIMQHDVEITYSQDSYIIFDKEGSGWAQPAGWFETDSEGAYTTLVGVWSNDVQVSGYEGYTAADGVRGYIAIFSGPLGLTFSTAEGFDFSGYSKICVDLRMYGGTGNVSSGGIGYINSIYQTTPSKGTYVSASSLGISNNVRAVAEIDISDISSTNFIMVRSPYGANSYVKIYKIWME